MNAIPTRYRGVLYRSRLEARWAAFFELLGWSYEYEPIDLNGWIPDFSVQVHPSEEPFLWECKPFLSLTERDVKTTQAKIKRAKPQHAVVLSGASLLRTDTHREIGIGAWLLDADSRWSSCFLTWASTISAPIPSTFDGWCVHDVDTELTAIQHLIAKGHWCEAGNRTQWRGAEAMP